MRHRLAALAVVLLVALPSWVGADPTPASLPSPIWPITSETRFADTRLLLTVFGVTAVEKPRVEDLR